MSAVLLQRAAQLCSSHAFWDMCRGAGAFCEGLMSGRARTAPLAEALTIESTTPWDGSEGNMMEEEFSLDDIMGDEL